MIKKIAIIGTAGRQSDKNKINRIIYQKMLNDLRGRLSMINEPIHLVSGGAGVSDHLAVLAFLRKFPNVESLELFFPCKWKGNKFKETKVGNTANYYHEIFSIKMGGTKESSLIEIQKAIDQGAIYHENTKGFHARNLQVGDVDYIIAYTFGESKSEPKDGGTMHTWKNSKALIKIHVPITLIGEENG